MDEQPERERVVVALTGGPEGENLIRRASQIALHGTGSDLLAVHVARNDGLAGVDPAQLARQRILVERLGGSYHQVVGADVATALLDFARGVSATQLVLGASRRGRLAQLLSPGVGATAAAESGPIDVHLVMHERVGRRRSWSAQRRGPGLSRRRRLAGFGLVLVGLPLLTWVLVGMRTELSLPTDILAFLVAVVAIALVGGLAPAVLAAVAGFGLLNYFFTPPLGQLTVAAPENLLALLVFLLIAVAVSTVVDLAARRTTQAAQARSEAETLSTLAGSVLRGARPLPALLARVRETFHLSDVTLLERDDGWRVVESVGERPSTAPDDGETNVAIDEDLSLVLRGRPLPAADRRVVEAFAAQAAVALRQQRLGEQAAKAGTLAEVDRLRTALLSAVSHDLRTPLAAARAAVSSLQGSDVTFTEHDRKELLATADESLAKLARLVEDLLDLSRLQAGALGIRAEPMSVVELVPRVLDDLGPATAGVAVHAPAELPEVCADPALVERILVNLLGNALRFSPPASPASIIISEYGDEVQVRVIDHGPGVPVSDRERIFLPFQRLGDRTNEVGVGLGLALSRGFAEAMGGSVTPESTPGGGLTMTLSLPVGRIA